MSNKIVLTQGQALALQKIKEWLKNPESQIFTLAGCAGSGKSTVVSMVAREMNIEDKIVYTAFTGKAVSILAENDVEAYTMHKLMYNVRQEDGKIRFEKKASFDNPDWKLVVVDEASMVNAKMVNDLLSFKKKILIVGDPHQLPPIGEENKLFSQSPDVLLTEIVRQAEGSPIIQLSQRILKGQTLPYGAFGHGVVICNKREIPTELFLKADQVLCGLNETRADINKRMRFMQGFKDVYPEVGEKIICTKNNWNIQIGCAPLINGMTGYVEGIENKAEKYLFCKFRPERINESRMLRVSKALFEGKTPSRFDQTTCCFEFGYCITVHKAQGSTYDNIIVLKDNMMPNIEKQWLYTAVTRPRKGLIIGL